MRRRLRRRRRRVWTLVGLGAVLAGGIVMLALAVPVSFIGSHGFSVRGQPVERSAELRRRRGRHGLLPRRVVDLPDPAGMVRVYSADEYAVGMSFSIENIVKGLDDRIRKVKTLGPDSYIVALPRSAAFTPVVTALAKQRVRFHDLAGNDEILLTAIAPRELDLQPVAGRIVVGAAILTNPATKRIGLRVPVRTLHLILTDLPARGASVEHLYDY